MAIGRPRVFGSVSEEEIRGRALVRLVAYEVEPPDRVTLDSTAGGVFGNFWWVQQDKLTV